jgi:hypothetical protein
MASTALTRKLQQVGFNLPFDISRYIEQAIREFPEDPMTYAWALVIRSPEFDRAFPGIKRKDGTLRMNIPDYMHTTEAYRSIAARYGFAINNLTAGHLVSMEVSPDEFVERAAAVQIVKAHPDVFRFLQQADPGKMTTVRDAVNFVLRKADPEFYSAYETATFQAAAKGAELPITRSRAQQIAAATAGVMSLAEQESAYQKIAKQIREAGAELSAFGLTQADLETIEFGVGDDRAGKALRAEQALKQYQTAVGTEIQGESLVFPQGRPQTPYRVEATQ